MNKTYKYTLTAHEKKEISFGTGVARLAIANGDGVDGSTTVIMSEITKQHSGDIVSFIDGADAPFADFIVDIVAQQSGTGDPSPTNVRPISGWTGATINVSGEDTSDPTTYNINWQSTAGTVYGGTLDVKTGESIVTHIKKLGSECVWQVQDSSRRVYYTSSFNTIKKEGNTNIICDSYATSNATTVTNMNNLTIRGRVSDGNIYIRDSNYASLEDFTSAVANVEIMFELKTPITYQLTPTEIRSLLGVNNVWADCGLVNVRYFVQSTQPMIDYIDDKTITYFDAQEDLSTYDISLVGATSTDIKNCLLANKNANIVIRVKRYSTILLYYLREYSPNYFVEFATPAVVFDAEGTKSIRIDYLRLDLTQETADFTKDYIILPTT